MAKTYTIRQAIFDWQGVQPSVLARAALKWPGKTIAMAQPEVP